MSEKYSQERGSEVASDEGRTISRRDALKALALTPLAAAAAAQDREPLAVKPEMIENSEWLTGLRLDEEKRTLMSAGMEQLVRDFGALREVSLDNSVRPSLRFDPTPHSTGTVERQAPSAPTIAPSETSPGSEEDLAFASIRELAGWLGSGRISSVELTQTYLDRLTRYDPDLLCVVHLTSDLALSVARRADEIRAQNDPVTPLLGIPWGAKDLLAHPGAPTTWGATPYRDQQLDETATVVQRLESAGAPLAAKLSVGALAWGDVWYGGTTKNPWNLEQGSSGSSAGPAAATAAGLVGFTIGTETWGSIVSPCTRCGATGLRPTFGRVSRHGAMALSWSMDKIGPIARSAEDCAFIFDAIHGTDGYDPTVQNRPFTFPAAGVDGIRIGFVPELFDEDRSEGIEQEDAIAAAQEWQEFDKRTLHELESFSGPLLPVELPSDLPVSALAIILTAEASAAFDELTRSGRDAELVRQIEYAWPNVFRQGQMIPAVEYIRANRIRTLLQQQADAIFDEVDVYVSPSYVGNNMLSTNLTGHPSVVLPNGFRSGNGTPTSITFTGRLFGESELLRVAMAYQEATDYHRKRPPLTR